MRLVINQSECNAAFRSWADTLIENARPTPIKNARQPKHGWMIEGKGVLFTNYGHGDRGEIAGQVMLGFDESTGSSTVKIVQPNGAKRDKGPVTVLATNDEGRRYLLRQGRLKENQISGFIKDEFAKLSGLTEVPLFVDGRQSGRHWYVVADLDAKPDEIVAQTADFAIACALARTQAGCGKAPIDERSDEQGRPTYGMDEEGRITTRVHPGGPVEVRELQGYVFRALKNIIGEELKKPKRSGYCVDGFIQSANLLVEIKTSTSANCIYEAVGQLRLYPSLVGISCKPDLALIIPDSPPLRPQMVAALVANNILIFTYNIDMRSRNPRITFSDALIKRCSNII